MNISTLVYWKSLLLRHLYEYCNCLWFLRSRKAFAYTSVNTSGEQYEIDNLLGVSSGTSVPHSAHVVIDDEEGESDVVATPLNREELAAYMNRRERQRRGLGMSMQEISGDSFEIGSGNRKTSNRSTTDRSESSSAWSSGAESRTPERNQRWKSVGDTFNLPAPQRAAVETYPANTYTPIEASTPSIHSPEGWNGTNRTVITKTDVSGELKANVSETPSSTQLAQAEAKFQAFSESNGDEDGHSIDSEGYQRSGFPKHDSSTIANNGSTTGSISLSSTTSHSDDRASSISSNTAIPPNHVSSEPSHEALTSDCQSEGAENRNSETQQLFPRRTPEVYDHSEPEDQFHQGEWVGNSAYQKPSANTTASPEVPPSNPFTFWSDDEDDFETVQPLHVRDIGWKQGVAASTPDGLQTSERLRSPDTTSTGASPSNESRALQRSRERNSDSPAKPSPPTPPSEFSQNRLEEVNRSPIPLPFSDTHGISMGGIDGDDEDMILSTGVHSAIDWPVQTGVSQAHVPLLLGPSVHQKLGGSPDPIITNLAPFYKDDEIDPQSPEGYDYINANDSGAYSGSSTPFESHLSDFSARPLDLKLEDGGVLHHQLHGNPGHDVTHMHSTQNRL